MQTEDFSIIGASGTWMRNGLIRVLRYDSGQATAGATPTIRVRPMSGNAFDVQMNPGRTITLSEPAKGLMITNFSTGADISGKFTYGDGSVADDAIVGTVGLDAGTIAALESISLNAATLDVLTKPLQATGWFVSSTVHLANTAVSVVAAGANLSGLVVLSASCQDSLSSGGKMALLAKATAPINVNDGEPIFAPGFYAGGTTFTYPGGVMPSPQHVAAGLGLWWIADFDTTGSSGRRACRWKAL